MGERHANVVGDSVLEYILSIMNVDFYYDIRSPYTYLAWERRNVLMAAGAQLTYVPVSVDVLLNLQAGKKAGAEYADPLAPPKRQHMMSDIPRLARYWGIPFGGPFTFKPQATKAMCLATALQSSGLDQEEFVNLALKTLWLETRDLSDNKVLKELASVANLDSFEHDATLRDLTKNTELAYQAGIFGVPSFRHENQIYFGADRVDVLASELNQF